MAHIKKKKIFFKGAMMARKKMYKGEQNTPCDTMVCLTQQLEKWFLLKSLSPPNQNSFPIEPRLLITSRQRNPPSHPWIKFFCDVLAAQLSSEAR